MKFNTCLILGMFITIFQLKAQNSDFPHRKSDKQAKKIIEGTWSKYIEDIEKKWLHAVNRRLDNTQQLKNVIALKTFYFDQFTADPYALEELDKIRYRSGNNNPKMLNEFLSKEVSSFFSDASDLSLQRFYANYNSEAKTINIGVNWDPESREELSRLNWIYTAGLQIKTTDDFGVIVEDGEVKTENIGATLKFTKIFSPFFDFNSKDQRKTKQAEYFRKSALQKKYKKKIDSYIKSGFEDVRDSLNTIYYKTETGIGLLLNNPESVEIDSTGYDKAILNFAKKKQNSFYKEIATDEVTYIRENELFKLLETFWISLDAFVPFGAETVNTASENTSTEIKENKFYPFVADLSLSYLNKRPSSTSVLINTGISIKNNNNVLAESQSTIPFETVILQQEPVSGENGLSVTKTTDVFVTEYDEFYTPTLDFEFVYFLRRNKFFQPGLGVRFEQNFGNYNAFNFKAGLPIVIRDKNDKPTVNIEIQYRNINNTSQIGFATSILFGKLIN